MEKEDIEFLISMAACLFDDGMVNYTHDDWDRFKEIEKRFEEEYGKI